MFLEKLKQLFNNGSEPVFEEEWISILENNLPLYRKLPDELKQQLHLRIASFVESVRFEGCNGLELTDDMVLTVAAQACLLVIHRDGMLYPDLRVVYLYPSSFSSVHKSVDAMGIVTEGRVHRLGESWETGTIVLSWDSVEQGAHDIRDGHNVTFHEFAHQLDHEDGPTDGAPGLGSRAAYRSWARVFSENYSDFLELTERGRKTVLDAYGATNPAEFFAVTTETFFEKPVQLSEDRPDLYQELMAYYKVDPREWYE
jgi:Mlc titration factor MtfA (ptsG expression regulator)